MKSAGFPGPAAMIAEQTRMESVSGVAPASPWSSRVLFRSLVLRLRFLQDGDIGVRVLPQRKEVLIRGPGFCRVASHYIRPAQAQLGQRVLGDNRMDPAMIHDLLKFRRRFRSAL